MAVLLSLLINKHGQKKGDRPLYKCRAYPSGSKKTLKSKRGKNERGRSFSQVKKHSSYYFIVAVKSSGDIFAEPATGQKIEEHVVTYLDVRNHDNRPSLTSSAAAEERQEVSSKNTIDELSDAITGCTDIGLWSSNIPEKCGNIG